MGQVGARASGTTSTANVVAMATSKEISTATHGILAMSSCITTKTLAKSTGFGALKCSSGYACCSGITQCSHFP